MSETERTGSQIVEDAWRAFDEWLAAQSDDVRGLDIHAQARLHNLSASQPERATE